MLRDRQAGNGGKDGGEHKGQTPSAAMAKLLAKRKRHAPDTGKAQDQRCSISPNRAAVAIGHARFQPLANPVQQPLRYCQRQTLPGLAVRAGVQPAPRTPFGDALRQVPPDHILAGAVFGQNLADKRPQCGQRWVEPIPLVARFRRHDVDDFLAWQNLREHPVPP